MAYIFERIFMMYVDSHCHIEDEAVLKRAFEAGVTTLLNAGKDLDEAEAQLKMCEKYPNVWTSAGVHPDSAPDKLSSIGVEDIIKMTTHPKVIAIGECGLDYHYGAEFKKEQKEMFTRHVEASGRTGLPLMIHQREAEEDLLKILYDGVKKFGKLTGVIHCFTSTLEFAEAVKALGFYISASGIVTFKSGAEVANVFTQYPLDKILIETDSPYLAPVPFRGKVNEPAFVLETARKIAEIRGLTCEEIARITRDNFYCLYQKAKEFY